MNPGQNSRSGYSGLTDYHSHTPLCRHAEGTPEAYVDAALRQGLAEYGVSDHGPSPNLDDDWRMAVEELPEYLQWVEEARRHAGPDLPVRLGLECDFLPGEESWLDTLRGRADWDYWIGSVHYIADDWAVDDPRIAFRIGETGVEETWGLYWKCYLAAVRSGRFEIMGHPDLVKKFGQRPAGDLRRYYEPVVEAMADVGCACELNTAGWHKECGEAYPAAEFLALCAEAEIPLVLSSDAHAPEEVARDFSQARNMALDAGYTHLARFAGGQRSMHPLQ